MSKQAILLPLQKKDNINRWWKNKELKSDNLELMKKISTFNKKLSKTKIK